jgi:hypothetical protein
MTKKQWGAIRPKDFFWLKKGPKSPYLEEKQSETHHI